MAGDKSAVLDKAQIHIQKGQWNKAVELMEEADRLDGSDPHVTLRLGDLCKKLGRIGDAALYYCRTADIFAGSGQTTKAAATYKMVLRLDPTQEGVQEKLDRLTARNEAAKRAQDLADGHPTQAEPAARGIDPAAGPGPEDGRPMEVYYGAVAKEESGDDEAEHETIPGLVELGSTVGRLVPMSGQGDGSGDNGPGGIELSAGAGDVRIESFAMNKEADRRTPVPAGRPTETTSAAGGHDMFSDFAADVQAPPEAADAIGVPSPPDRRPRREIEFLTDLGEDELWELLGRMDRLTFGPDEPIIREGEAGDSMYIITSGRVLVTTTNNGMRVRLAELGENDFFGEVSFLTGKPRTADVTAMETTTLMVFSRVEMDNLIDKYPGVERVLRMFQKDRVSDTMSTLKTLSEGML